MANLIISGIALLISLCNFLLYILARIPRIDFKVLDYRTDSKSCKVYVTITNLSAAPLGIYNIQISADGITQPCFLLPKPVRKDNELMFYTAQFPINLPPHQAGSYFLEYRNFPENKPIALVENKTVHFQVFSNRLKKEISVILGKPDHYLHIR